MFSDVEFPTLQEFKTFLDLGVFYGFTTFENWSWTGCPMWAFLSQRYANPTVYRDGTWHPEPQIEYVDGLKMPPWAAEFVWLSDLIKPRSMTFDDCLKLLENPLYRPEYWMTGKTRHQIRTIED